MQQKYYMENQKGKTMKIKAIKKAYYDDRIVEVGEILDVKLEKVPSWATLAGGKETKKEKTPEPEKVPEVKTGEQTPSNDEQKDGESEQTPEKINPEIVAGGVIIPETDIVEDENINNADKLAELDALITKGVEMGISIDIENKTVQQQIDELKEKISEAEKA